MANNEERMQAAYSKQCWSTIIAFVVVMLMTHIYPMYFLFPDLNEARIFGFPADYWLTIVVGWILLVPAFYIYIGISEKVDQEIADSSAGADDAQGDSQ